MNTQMMIYIEAAVIVLMALVFAVISLVRKNRVRRLVESKAYEANEARDGTLSSFPAPLAAFRISDSGIIWGNEAFFSMCGDVGSRLDAKITDLVPGFSGKWLQEGKKAYPNLVMVNDRKYRINGSIVRHSGNAETEDAYMGITYWFDVTEYEKVKSEYEESRPVVAVIVVDNLDELYKNQPDRVRNDILDAVGDLLREYVAELKGFVRRYDRDRFIAVVEERNLEAMKADRFQILEEVHKIENPAGVSASVSIGIGEDGQSFAENLQFADIANELALTRGGDQVVIKNKTGFEFFGGRTTEGGKRTKVRSRVMANTLAELIKDSSRVFVMGHKNSDLDSVGACVGICAIARKYNVNSYIVVNEADSVAGSLIARMKSDKDYRFSFMTPQDAMLKADGHCLLVVVDTNRPEQADDLDLLTACRKIAVIDHHRAAATYIQNATLSYIEPFASSTCELISEIAQELCDDDDILKCEAEALMTGMVLDTKNFTLRTTENTFDAASYLRRVGADTTEVKKLLQSDINDTISKYRILQTAELYRNIAIAVPTSKQTRVVAAQAADELLNISGVEASIVVATGANDTVFASARSIGELNVQMIMEKLGGGGNRSAAAVQLTGVSLEEAVERVYRAIDEYLG